jgi:hypothetical protein
LEAGRPPRGVSAAAVGFDNMHIANPAETCMVWASRRDAVAASMAYMTLVVFLK